MNEVLKAKLVFKKDGESYKQAEVEELQEKVLKVEDLENMLKKSMEYKQKFTELDQNYTVLVPVSLS